MEESKGFAFDWGSGVSPAVAADPDWAAINGYKF
jgi:hypothetical protein